MVCLMGAMDGAATGFMTSDFFGGIGVQSVRHRSYQSEIQELSSRYGSMKYYYNNHGLQTGSELDGKQHDKLHE